MTTILLVEDDHTLAQSLTDYLTKNGFKVTHADTLKDAQNNLKANTALILLDWMLPDGEGVDFVNRLRKSNSQVPVIFLTARADLIDRVVGLESGANDFLSKPFEPRELVARIRARLRDRAVQPNEDLKDILCGPFRVLVHTHEAWYKNQKLELTRMEFALLSLLLSQPGRVFTREELLNKVWGFERAPTTRTVDTHILMLRNKTSDACFETIRGIGYKFVIQDEN